MPTAVLEKVLEYVNPGNDPFEDNLDFELDIKAYKLEEKYKPFFEEENGFILDFTKFQYFLRTEYLYPRIKDEEQPSGIKIIYADDDAAFAEKFMNTMKEQYLPDSTWYHFANCEEAISFYKDSLENVITIQLIVIGNNDEKKAVDCIMSLQKIASAFEVLFMKYTIPVVVLTNDAYQINFRDKKFKDSWSYFHYPRNEDMYILGNSLKNIVNTPYYHTIIPTVFWY